jgi:hypothetical protein
MTIDYFPITPELLELLNKKGEYIDGQLQVSNIKKFTYKELEQHKLLDWFKKAITNNEADIADISDISRVLLYNEIGSKPQEISQEIEKLKFSELLDTETKSTLKKFCTDLKDRSDYESNEKYTESFKRMIAKNVQELIEQNHDKKAIILQTAKVLQLYDLHSNERESYMNNRSEEYNKRYAKDIFNTLSNTPKHGFKKITSDLKDKLSGYSKNTNEMKFFQKYNDKSTLTKNNDTSSKPYNKKYTIDTYAKDIFNILSNIPKNLFKKIMADLKYKLSGHSKNTNETNSHNDEIGKRTATAKNTNSQQLNEVTPEIKKAAQSYVQGNHNDYIVYLSRAEKNQTGQQQSINSKNNRPSL